MGLKWTDTHEIAIQLNEAHPHVNPMTLRFTDLRRWIMDLPEFDDDPSRCGEKILEAVQMVWISERDA